jgi:hypothetical protein
LKARDSYTLEELGPDRRSGLLRRLVSAAVAIVTMREPVDPGGGEILIADAFAGRVVGSVPIPLGDDGAIRARLEEDLLTMKAGEFAEKWL